MKKRIAALFLPLLMTFSSCGDIDILYTATIKNQTDDTIRIYFNGRNAYIQTVDSVICFPHTSNLYQNHIGGKIVKNVECNPRIEIDGLTIEISHGKKLKKDITNKNNWVCHTDNNKSYWHMFFTIEPVDLE